MAIKKTRRQRPRMYGGGPLPQPPTPPGQREVMSGKEWNGHAGAGREGGTRALASLRRQNLASVRLRHSPMEAQRERGMKRQAASQPLRRPEQRTSSNRSTPRPQSRKHDPTVSLREAPKRRRFVATKSLGRPRRTP